MNTKLVIGWISALTLISSVSLTAWSQDGETPDPFGGRFFAPNIILEHQSEVGLSDSQRQEIRELVISTQTEISENQWDMREAYQDLMSELDKPTIDESTVTEMMQIVLQTENRVKLAHVSMLVRLRNLLTEDQVATLRSVLSRNE